MNKHSFALGLRVIVSKSADDTLDYIREGRSKKTLPISEIRGICLLTMWECQWKVCQGNDYNLRSFSEKNNDTAPSVRFYELTALTFGLVKCEVDLTKNSRISKRKAAVVPSGRYGEA